MKQQYTNKHEGQTDSYKSFLPNINNKLTNTQNNDTKNKIAAEVLNRFSKFLIKKQTDLSVSSRDGRVNSAINEDEIYKDLKGYCLSNEWFAEEKKLQIEKPKVRNWYDFSITNSESNLFIPVNIKVTACSSADNLNCKLGLYYALTGIIPTFSNGISWDEYFKALHTSLNFNTSKDYYFFIVDKINRKNVFFSSLKTIKELVPNGNNLPFQCQWSKNTEREYREHELAVKYLLSVLGKSICQRASIANSFNYYFPDFYKGGNDINE